MTDEREIEGMFRVKTRQTKTHYVVTVEMTDEFEARYQQWLWNMREGHRRQNQVGKLTSA